MKARIFSEVKLVASDYGTRIVKGGMVIEIGVPLDKILKFIQKAKVGAILDDGEKHPFDFDIVQLVCIEDKEIPFFIGKTEKNVRQKCFMAIGFDKVIYFCIDDHEIEFEGVKNNGV